MANDTKHLAVLIDAENAQSKIITELLSEIAKLGSAIVKRIYGDFNSPHLTSWNGVLLDFSIKPMHQVNNTRGKNASDIGLVIDAMDLLNSGKYDGFCLVSSDSDFTGLASRIREEGVLVYGFGEKKTPKSFVAACDRFIYTENLRQKAADTAAAGIKVTDNNGNPLPLDVFKDAVDSKTEDGWAHLGQVGQVINNQLSDFDPRNYGYRNLVSLVEATQMFDLKRPGGQRVYFRVKEAAGEK